MIDNSKIGILNIKRFILLFSLFVVGFGTTCFSLSISAEVCEKIEFSELESFSKKELTDTYCKHLNNITNVINNGTKKIVTGEMDVTIFLNFVSASTASCVDEQKRIKRILQKKYKLQDKELASCDIEHSGIIEAISTRN